MRRMLLPAAVLASLALITSVALAASSPTVSTRPATKVTKSSAVLQGTVRPNGTKTYYRFVWGLSRSALGEQTPVHVLRAGTKPDAVSAPISGLYPGTTYYYEVLALNSSGSATSAPRSFHTAGHPLPAPETGPAVVQASNTAVLTGAVNPNGEATTWYFQYRVPGGTWASVPTPSGSLPAGKKAVIVSATASGLRSLTTYQYQLVVIHSGFSPQYGALGSFLTFPSPRPKPRVISHTTPHRERFRPFQFLTTGRVVRPAKIPQAECFERVTVTFFAGRRVVGRGLAYLAPNCTYRAVTSIGRLPRHNRSRPLRLRVVVHFRGNGYMAPANAKVQRVLVG